MITLIVCAFLSFLLANDESVTPFHIHDVAAAIKACRKRHKIDRDGLSLNAIEALFLVQP